jgi:SAM-dependent methyltransferase
LPGTLGDGRGDARERARAVFNTVAELYDRARPGYPAELYEDLFARVEVGRETRVLEVGCGTGQATRIFAQRGCRIRCIELGPDLAAIARRNLAPFPNVDVEVGAFETVELAARSADVVFSAMAFHWIEPAVGFPKAAEALDTGGHLVLFTNAHVAGGGQERIAADVHEIHERLAPEITGWSFPPGKDVRTAATAGGDIAEVWSRIDRRFYEPPEVSAFFDEPFVGMYPWTATFDRDLYLAWLETQSTYALLHPKTRQRVLAEIGAIIDSRLGGTVTKPFLGVLAIARRK